jgi:hypothetical protein
MVCDTIQVISICEPVSDLTSSVAGYEVTLTWSAPELISEVLHYNIYRDGDFIVSVETESFNDIVPSGDYVYSVEVEYVNECVSDEVSIDVTVFVLVLPPPENLKIDEIDNSLELSWEYEDDEILFNVYRDDVKIGENLIEKQYLDTNVVVNVEYCYYIKATNEEIESEASNEECATIIFDKIEEYTSNLKVYPNPSNSIMNIEGEHIEKITIHNSIGQIVKIVSDTENIIQIDVSNFAKGNYVFSVSYSNGSTENVKIIVQ